MPTESLIQPRANRGWLTAHQSKLGSATIYSLNMASYAPNGDVLAAKDSVNGNWTYTYDALNRLVGSNQNSGAAVYSYVYDRFGNRWQQNGPLSFLVQFTGNNPGSPANTNRIDGYSYDTAGNLTYDGIHTFTYDAENRLISVVGGTTNSTYSYDADGRRIMKTGDVAECNYNGTTNYLYDIFGHASVYTNGGTNNCRDEIFAGNRHLATYNPDTVFVQADWLGTERVRRSYAGQITQTCTSLPFGDNLACAGAADPSHYSSPLHFTGKEFDSESGLDNFGARYDAPTMGRFMSPDWSTSPTPVPYASLPYPQSLNLYSYVQNNPLRSADPTGHCTVDGETHGWVWCAAHSLGFTETMKETAARKESEARWSAFVQKHPEYQMWNIMRGPLVILATMGAGAAAEGGGGTDSTATPEENGAIDAGAAAGAEAGVARTMVNDVPQPAAEGEIIVGPNGTAVKIPAGYVAERARSGSGIVYRLAGTTGDANTIRIMGANARQGARIIIYNSQGQPIVPSTGRTGSAAQTHTPID